jgi:anti-sigma B factor antagonist
MPVESRQLESGVAVVAIAGRLCLGAEVARLDAAVSHLLKQEQKKIVLDLTALEYCDSAGISTLVSCLTKVKKADGEMRIAGPNQRVQRILKMTGVDKIMSMFGNLSEASAW